MKRLVAFLSIFIVFSGLIFCYELTLVSELESNSIAQNWIIYINKIPLKNKLGEYNIRFIEQVNHNGNLLCEIYHLYPRGHILVPSYKEFPPIKSFSVASDFDPESKGYEYAVLEELKAAYDFLKSYNQEELEELEREIERNSGQWNEFLRMNLERAHLEDTETTENERRANIRNFVMKDDPEVLIESVHAPPLLETKWGQGWPFYNQCPSLGSEQCIVGCGATAMAQIMRYHKWPKKGNGSRTYYWNRGGRYLSANFSDSYDWNYMPNEYGDYDTAREQDAAAELCYEVGVSMDTNYGPDASWVYSFDIEVNAFKNYFKYSNDVKVVYRSNYSNVNKWFEVLKRQRDLLRPLDFFIARSDIGHATVVDGYLITNGLKQVHINMGWYGNSDDYYTLDNILDFTENQWQNAIIDIVPIQTTFALTLTSGPAGTTNPSPGTYTYNFGTQVTIRAIPNTGYRFFYWSGDASGSANPKTITMDSDKSIKANFKRVYRLTLFAGAGGTTSPSPGIYNKDDGTSVTISAIPNTYYGFKGWSGSASGRTNPINITMNSDKRITARFIKINPPLSFTGQKVYNYSFTQDEYINTLAWQPNPYNENIAKYKLYLVEGGQSSLLSEFSKDTFEYLHRNVERDKQYTYALVAVNDRSREGEPASVTIQ